MSGAPDSVTTVASDSLTAAVSDSGLITVSRVSADTTAIVAQPLRPEPGVAVPPEQIGMWALLGILYPLLLLVGVRLLRIGTRRARGRARRYLDDWYEWLLGAGVSSARARILRRSGDLGLRLAELAVYLLSIYGFSLYFFLLIPGTRELGVDMASQLWPPLRAAVLLGLRTISYVAFSTAVLLTARWAVPRLRARLGTDAARPATSQERERMLVLHSAAWLVRFVAALVIVVMLPGPGKAIGLMLLALVLVVSLIASRRTLENVAAGFSVGRAAGARRGTRIACAGCEGVIEEWTATGLRIRADDGRLVHLPYRLCEESPLVLEEPPISGSGA